MKLSKVRIFTGVSILFLQAGIVALSIIAGVLWGTGFVESASQKNVAFHVATPKDVSAIEKEADKLLKDPNALKKFAEALQQSEKDGALNPTVFAGNKALAGLGYKELISLLPSNGSAIGRIRIPKIGVDKFVVEGAGVSDLRKGPGHYSSTPLPGQPGNVSIAGHRTTYGAPFNRIDELSPGDKIIIDTLTGSHEYRVLDTKNDGKGYFVVKPSENWVLSNLTTTNFERRKEQQYENIRNLHRLMPALTSKELMAVTNCDTAINPGCDLILDKTLTLTSCNPKGSASQRIIVRAEYLGVVKERPVSLILKDLQKALIDVVSKNPTTTSQQKPLQIASEPAADLQVSWWGFAGIMTMISVLTGIMCFVWVWRKKEKEKTTRFLCAISAMIVLEGIIILFGCIAGIVLSPVFGV